MKAPRVLLTLVLVALAGSAARGAAPDMGTEAQREAGKKLYAKFCSQCHGVNGDGEGDAAIRVRPAPRNFTTGKYKIRSTGSGALPTHQDLENVIQRGMPGTSMPAWPDFSKEELSNLAYYVASFSSDFSNPELAPTVVPLPKAPAATKESAEKGRKVYEESGCVGCHGNAGLGDGPSAPTLVDDWGHPIRPADLSERWLFRGGASREDIFRTFSTGLNGSPMPSFLDALTPEQRWNLTDYIDSLSPGAGPGYSDLLQAKHVEDPIDLTKGAAAFAGARVSRFPIVGQIMEPGRSFHPPASAVLVQAIYDAESLALLVRWHDLSAESTGKNGPALPVPVAEEELRDGAGAAAPEGAASGDVWGDEQAEPPAPPAGGGDVWEEDATAAAAPATEFSDAAAVQLPATLPTGARKPYFIFGDSQNAVDLWFFDLARPEPQQFTGKGSADVAPNDTGELSGVARYDNGEWSVLFKRPLRTTAGVSFTPGAFVPISFSVWDGLTRERGNRRGLTVWYHLYLEPEVVVSPIGPMLKTALLVLALEVVAIFWVRRRYATNRTEPLAADRIQESPS